VIRPVHLALPALVLGAGCVVLAPRPLRRVARAGVGIYGLSVAAQSVRAAQGDRRDAAALPLVFATMHGAWGAGFIVGLIRFAPPSRRRPALATDLVARSS
jgi:hypothetical protein